MGFIDNIEFRGILIALTGYILLSSAVNYFLGKFSLKFPWLLLPLCFALFLASKYFTDRIPFLHGNGYLGQVFQILLVILSYSLFTKSLMFYLDSLLPQYAYAFLGLGFIMIVFAAKHHLKGSGGD